MRLCEDSLFTRLHFVRGTKEEADRVAEKAKNHCESGRQTDGSGFSARHSSREYGYTTSSSEELGAVQNITASDCDECDV